MPLTFLNPALLWGALAAAVPIVLHLLNRRRVRDIPFSDLRFLEEVQVTRSRSLGLRRWLLLLLRVLAVLLIVGAVARPRLAGLAPGESGRVSLLAVIDASASMQTLDDGDTRFASALAYAADVSADLPGGSEVQALLAADEARAVFADWLRADAAAAEALIGLDPTDGAFDLPAALAAAARWAGEARHPPAVVLLLTDLQLAAPAPEALAAAATALRAAGVERVLLRRFGETVLNGGVRDLHLPLRAVRPDETFTLGAEVLVARNEQTFWLELDGVRAAEAVSAAAPGEADSLVFALTAPPPGRHTGRVATDADPFAVDDDRPFVLDVPDSLRVLLVHGPERGAAGGGGWRYWRSALAPDGGDAAASSLFRLTVRPDTRLETGDLESADLILLLDTGPLGRAAVDALARRLRAGAGVLVQCGDPTRAGYLSATLLPALDLDGRLAFRTRSEAGAASARVLDRAHPVFEGLGDAAIATLERARWRRHFAVADSGLTVLMADDADTPLLAAGTRGRGRFALLPFNLLSGSSDLARNPMFPPLAQRLGAWLAGAGGRGEANLRVGAVPRLAPPGGAAPADPPILHHRLPGEAASSRLDARLAWHDGRPLLEGDTARRRGLYVFMAGGDTLGAVAVAPPPAESDPRLEDPERLRERLAAVGLELGREVETAAAAGFATALRGRDLAPWLLLAAVLLLLAETALSRRAG